MAALEKFRSDWKMSYGLTLSEVLLVSHNSPPGIVMNLEIVACNILIHVFVYFNYPVADQGGWVLQEA